MTPKNARSAPSLCWCQWWIYFIQSSTLASSDGVEVTCAPGVNRRQSALKTATHISVDLVIVLFRVDVTCHTSRVTVTRHSHASQCLLYINSVHRLYNITALDQLPLSSQVVHSTQQVSWSSSSSTYIGIASTDGTSAGKLSFPRGLVFPFALLEPVGMGLLTGSRDGPTARLVFDGPTSGGISRRIVSTSHGVGMCLHSRADMSSAGMDVIRSSRGVRGVVVGATFMPMCSLCDFCLIVNLARCCSHSSDFGQQHYITCVAFANI